LNVRLGRWLGRDPLGYVDGPHLYQFARSQPLVGNDPEETWSRKMFCEQHTRLRCDNGTCYSVNRYGSARAIEGEWSSIGLSAPTSSASDDDGGILVVTQCKEVSAGYSYTTGWQSSPYCPPVSPNKDALLSSLTSQIPCSGVKSKVGCNAAQFHASAKCTVKKDWTWFPVPVPGYGGGEGKEGWHVASLLDVFLYKCTYTCSAKAKCCCLRIVHGLPGLP